MTDVVESQEIDETAELESQEGEVQEPTENVEENKAEEIAAKEEEIAKQKEETRNRRKERNNRRATAHIQKLESELQKMREEMAYLRGRTEQRTDDPEPNPDDYVTARDYQAALLDWGERQEPEIETHPDQEITPVAQGPQIEPEVIEAYQAAGEERFGDDFNDMMEAAANGDFDCSPFMAETIFRSEQGPELAMYLYDHPREASKIARMTPAAQVREMLKLEAKQPKKPQVSRAPAPVNPEKGGNPTVTDLSKPMDTAEYIRQRRAQMQRK